MLSKFKIKPRKYNLFATLMQVMFLLFAAVIILKLVQLQVFESHNLKEKARQMRQPSRAFSFRGEIIDRNGIRLAADTTLYDIYAHPHYYSDSDTPTNIAAKLAPYLNIPENKLADMLSQKLPTITLVRGVSRDTGLKIKKLRLRYISLAKKNERVYPQGNLASHILGYVNPDADVYAGVERTGSRGLETLPNVKPIEYTGKGDVIYDINTDPVNVTSPLTGERLTLTIDSAIQHIAETELSKMIKKTSAERGTVIVMNPKNGEILAFAVLPSYNPTKYKKTDASIVKNWVLSDVYPPGSTFKILTVASALNTGSITRNERIHDTGKIKIQGWEILNYDYSRKGAPGTIDLKYLFEHSSNVGSVKVALKIPPYEHYKMLRLFGIGSKTKIDLPGESAGIIPEPDTWDNVRQATIGFGYSIAATPIQMAAAVAALANNGIWVTPHVIKYSNEEYEKRIEKRTVLSPETCKTMTDLLSSSIEGSESQAGKIPNYRVAGKTGTSRKPNPHGPGYLSNQVFTSFAGYFPAKNPRVLVMVVIDNPRGVEVWGSTVAGPVFNNVATEVARILNLEPDAPGLHVKKKEKI